MEDEDTEGWDIVQRPSRWDLAAQRGAAAEVVRLPPPPSDAFSTRHWERAMITDYTRPAARLPTGQKLMEQLVPLGQGAFAGASAAADKGLRLWRGLRGGS